jgi:aspartyl-tRNA(Asn)/glutamyl-tRNA(Gln) amidotransferase subunit A
MAGDDIAYKSAQELTALYRAGTLSPVEVAEALFARLDDLQPKINAFCVVDRDGALAAARASEQRWRAGDDQGFDADARAPDPARLASDAECTGH